MSEVREEYVGRSLAYIRILIGAKAHYPSAKEAAKNLHLSHSDPPPLGAVCFFDSEPFGNCGLHVGDRRVLTITHDGAVLISMDDPILGGPFIGWCPAAALRGAGLGWPRERG